MEIMFSSPKMIVMLVLGVFIISIFVGAIGIAIVQVCRGKFRVDYDQLASKAIHSKSSTTRTNSKGD